MLALGASKKLLTPILIDSPGLLIEVIGVRFGQVKLWT